MLQCNELLHCNKCVEITQNSELLSKPAWEQLLQQLQHLRLTPTTLYSAHFLSLGHVSHTCTNVQHRWALLMLAIKKITFVRIKKANHFGNENITTEQWLVCPQLVLPSVFECLHCETFVRQQKHLSARDNKHLKTATVTGFTQIWHLFVFAALPRYWLFSLKFQSDRGKHL